MTTVEIESNELESPYVVVVVAQDENEQQEILVNVRALGYEARVA